MKIKLRPYDTARYLDSEEMIQLYLEEALEIGDPAFIAQALGTVARARGMSKVAKDSGLSRESLYKALGPNGNPEFATVMRVIDSLGLQLTISTRNVSRKRVRSRVSA